MAGPLKTRSADPRPPDGAALTGTDTSRSLDPRDVEIARIMRERDEWRARERIARAEAEQLQARLTQLARASQRFAASMRSGTGERQRYRRRIAAQYAVSRVLAGARDLDEAACEIMQILGERLGWEVGVLWTLSGEELRCESTWRSPNFSSGSFEEACRQTSYARGVGLPGRAWSSGEPVRSGDIQEEDDPLRESAAEAGLRGGLAFPVRNGGLVGVFELLRAAELAVEEDLLQTAALVGRQIGQFVERRQAETERNRSLLREREARRDLSVILESISDAFFAVDREWRFTYVNRRAEELWSRSREDLLGKNLWEAFPQAAGSEQFEMIRRAMEECTTTSFEAVSPVAGVWVAGRAYPSANGGVAVYLDDVTERKRAKEERERLIGHELKARAQAEERRRLARELHDRVAHDIALVHQSLELYEVLKESTPDKAAAKMEVAKETVKQAFEATRNLSMELRQREIQRSLEAALSDLSHDLIPPDVAFDLSVDGDETRVPTEPRSQVFLILREAIRNAVTHSGCRRITVRSEILPHEITGCVEDDGRGVDIQTLRPAERNGLRSMEERAALLGGTLEVSSVPGGGMTVRVAIPLEGRDGG